MIRYLKLNSFCNLVLPVEALEQEKSNQYHGQDLLAGKTLYVTLSDINNRCKFEASCYLTLKKQQNNSRRTRHRRTWKTLF